MNIYLAGGFRSNWQQKVVDSFTKETSVTFYNPREHDLNNSNHYFFWDTLYLELSDIVFANLEESNPLALGLIFELGYARGLHKKVILIDDKTEKDTEYAKQFRFIRESVDVAFDSLEEGIDFLKSII